MRQDFITTSNIQADQCTQAKSYKLACISSLLNDKDTEKSDKDTEKSLILSGTQI